MYIESITLTNFRNYESLELGFSVCMGILLYTLAPEIVKLFSQTREKGWTLVPLKIYFKHGRAKLALALASGKHNYDKRQDLRKKADQRDIQRALKERQRD